MVETKGGDVTEIITILVYTYEKLSDEQRMGLNRHLWKWFTHEGIEPNSIQIE